MNEIFVCVLMTICTIFIIKYFLYRRQIQDICRQLQFLQTHDTNSLIRTSSHEKEILALAKQLNSIYEQHRMFRINLQKKDRRLKEMLAHISHDIRTPFTALRGFFQLMLLEEAQEKKDAYAAIIQTKLDEVTKLMDELFMYTKLQNEEYTLVLARENFTQLVLEVLFTFYDELKQLGITPQIEIEETPCFVLCNEMAVKRILTNMIRNAMLHGNGQIIITCHSSDTQVCFLCKNKVQEPDKIDMERIFERFYQADQARSSQSSGLGLPIAKGFADKMGGSLKAKLEDGWFTLKFEMDL